jgi:allantoicase
MEGREMGRGWAGKEGREVGRDWAKIVARAEIQGRKENQILINFWIKIWLEIE